ncbi:MAG: T9SS type A sorting domain-containing protein [Polaribacter sp.]
MRKKYTLVFIAFIISQLSLAQSSIVNTPDANFKNYLLDRSTINVNRDSEIQVSEAEAFTGRIEVKGSGKLDKYKVKDLTGLEAFTSLTELNIEHNEFTTIDISKNVELLSLEASNNELTGLDVTKNIKLEELELSRNKITSIDVTKNTELTKLWCSFNLLNTLDVSKNWRLFFLELEGNQFTTIDVANNIWLKTLNISDNQFTSIDISKNTQLSTLYCRNNLLTNLDISKNFKLDDIVCRSNNLSSLDMSKHRYATRLLAFANPNLNCIKVADETDTQKKCSSTRRSGWCVDEDTVYSETCGTASIYDEEFSNEILLFPNPVNDILKISIQNNEEIKSTKIFNILGKMILESKKEIIDVSNFPSGIYWLKIENTANKIALKRIIKE